MTDPIFFRRACDPTISEVAAWTGATIEGTYDADVTIAGVAPLDQARRGDLVFLDNPKYAGSLGATRASACLVPKRFAERVPAGTAALVTEEPYRAFAVALGKLFPEAAKPASVFGTSGISPSATVHPEARLEAGVVVDPGAVIGPRAEIGEGALIGANAVVGPDVRIGRGSSIGPGATVVHALIGDRVIVHAGVRIGQDGFGFAMGRRSHAKIPQVGRVVIQDDVEIGAGSTIDRGANRDTVIGEGTKIDNLVQIGHNVVVGRHCVIVSQAGISGSCTLGDFVAIGGQAGLTGHLKIGTGAQIAASAGLMNDVPAGERWVGAPAQPHRDFFREVAGIRKLVQRDRKAVTD